MKQFHPSNEAPFNGLLLLAAIGIIGGLILGGLMYAVSKLVYLVLFFPLIFGGIGGYLASFAIKKGKVRNPLLAVVMGAFIGILIYSVYNYAGFHFNKQDIYKVVMADPETAPAFKTLNSDQIMDVILAAETGSTGFIGYMKYQAKQGVSINDVVRPSKRGIELNETFTWLYFLLELLIFAATAGTVAYTAASEPFCDKCDTWYGKKSFVGSVDGNNSQQLLWALNRGTITQTPVNCSALCPTTFPGLTWRPSGVPHAKTPTCLSTFPKSAKTAKVKLILKNLLKALSAPATSRPCTTPGLG